MAVRIAINGFGRIGRLVYRIATERGGFEVVGVNDLVPADNLAYLLKYDSTHGRFGADVRADGESIVVNGKTTVCTAVKDPAQLPWKSQGVDYVVESTGLFTAQEDARKHLDAGAKRVLISAPTKSEKEVPTFVYGVNCSKYDPAVHTIASNASCTTNCLAPVIKVLLETCGLEEGLMTTVHAGNARLADDPSYKLTYSLKPSANNPDIETFFAVNPATGDVITTQAVNFSVLTGGMVYNAANPLTFNGFFLAQATDAAGNVAETNVLDAL
jgi:glyceraldehyde 3-phosphate dehydrogenase